MLSALRQDLRFALRRLRTQSGFTVLVVLTIGLGLGANATMFQIVDRLLFRPPAYFRDMASSGRVYFREPDGRGGQRVTDRTSYARFADLRDGTRSLDPVAAAFVTTAAVGAGTAARQRRIAYVSAGFWSLFDLRPVLGRVFTTDDERMGARSPVIVLSNALWRGAFGSDPHVLGRTLRVDGRDCTVIGVAPQRFNGTDLEPVSAWAPVTVEAMSVAGPAYRSSYDDEWLHVLARRRPGIALAAADADLTAALRVSAASDRTVRGPTASLRAELDPVLVDRGPTPSLSARVAIWLGGMSFIVLLLACANVAGLLVARAVREERSSAVRVALGASQTRLSGQSLLDVLLLVTIGAVVSFGIVVVAGAALQRVLPGISWTAADVGLRTADYVALTVLPVALLAGAAPAWRVGHRDPGSALRVASQPSALHRSRGFVALLVAQVALSTVLLVSAGLFMRSLDRARAAPLGFDQVHTLAVRVDATDSAFAAHSVDRYRDLADRLAALPFVESTGTTLTLPFEGQATYGTQVAGVPQATGTAFIVDAVGGNYFRAMGTRIERGRALGSSDQHGAPLAVVVSASMARALWGARDPLGQCVRVGGSDAPCSSVVGVAQDVRASDVSRIPRLAYYVAADQSRIHSVTTVVVRVRGRPTDAIAPIRAAVQRNVSPDAYVDVRPLEDIVAPQLEQWRLGSSLFGVFGSLALVIAMTGVYGLASVAAAQRRREMGIRIAVGAQREDILRLFVATALRVTLTGVAMGLVGALAGGRFIAPLLFATSATDGLVLAAAGAALLLAAIAATLVPAWRASRVDVGNELRLG